MQGAGDKLARDLAAVEFKKPRVPVLANVTGVPHPDDADGIRENLRKQVSCSVYWEKCCALDYRKRRNQLWSSLHRAVSWPV